MKWQDRKKEFYEYCKHCKKMTPMAWRDDKSVPNRMRSIALVGRADRCWHQCLECGKTELHRLFKI